MIWESRGRARDAEFTRLVTKINAYVASRDEIRRSLGQDSTASPLSNDDIQGSWATQFATYHHELDVLGEDWALEIFGRVHLRHFHPRPPRGGCVMANSGIGAFVRLKHAIFGEKNRRGSFPFFRSRQEDGRTSAAGPTSWRSLQRRYIKRKREIDERYAGLLGIRPVWGSHSWKLFFPVNMYDLLYGWPAYYAGQDLFKVVVMDTRLIEDGQPPPLRRVTVFVGTRRDSRLLYSARYRHGAASDKRCFEPGSWRNYRYKLLYQY